VLDELIPGARPEHTDPVRVPRRSRPFAPIGWRYRWVAADEVAFIARSGWLERTTDVVPHARTQSVELRQGPWQRRLGVATVEIHTPQGPVDADGPHLDAADARRVALAQLTRARHART
jgi:putative membrane protein